MKNSILLFSFFSLMLFSCLGDETETEPILEEELGWIEHPEYLNEYKTIRGIYELEDNLITLHDFGYGVKSYFDRGNFSQLNFFGLSIPDAGLRVHMPFNQSFPINDKFMVFNIVERPNSIFVYSLNEPTSLSTPLNGLEIKGSEIDPNFRVFNLIFKSTGNAFELNGNHILLSYSVNNDPTMPLRFAIIEVEQNTTSGFRVGTELISLNTFKSPQKEGLLGNGVMSMLSVEDGFIISTWFSLFKVDFEGNIKEFEKNNIYNGNEQYGQSYLVKDPRTNVIICADATELTDSYYSTDDGESWSVLTDYDQPDSFYNLNSLYYRELNGDLYGTIRSQIFKVSITPNSFMLDELDNSGLEGHEITGISSYYQDSLVMVSTYSGAFYKPLADFLKPKMSDSMGLFSGGF